VISLFCSAKPPTLITPASGAAHLSEQSRRPASNQRAADRAAVDPPFPEKSRSRQRPYKLLTKKLLLLKHTTLG